MEGLERRRERLADDEWDLPLRRRHFAVGHQWKDSLFALELPMM
jgi:hypothetical protein